MQMKPCQLKNETIVLNQLSYAICSLKDNQQYDDCDQAADRLGISSATWPLFGQVWPASIVMAMEVLALDLRGKQVLEIGCGIALSSIALHRSGIDITASDYHPLVQEFLDKNVIANGLAPIKYQTGNWETENPQLGRFDVIIGSDVLYQPAHAQAVAQFIDRHSSPQVQVLIVDPGRANRTRFTARMIDLGYLHRSERFDQGVDTNHHCKGHLLHYHRGNLPLEPQAV